MKLFSCCLGKQIYFAQPFVKLYLYPTGQVRTLIKRRLSFIKSFPTAKKSSNLVLTLCGLPSIIVPFVKVVQCRPIKNRVSESSLYRESNKDKSKAKDGPSNENIPWGELWSLLLPYIHYLVGAIAVLEQSFLFIYN